MSETLSLADIPAGPDLAAALAHLSQRRGKLDGAQLVEFITHTQRLNDWADSLQVSNVNELAYCPPVVPEPDAPRLEHRSELVPGVIEAALGWPRGWARRFDNVAYLLAELFPATHAALAEGLIHLPAARVIADGIAVLDNEDVRAAIEAAILAWLRDLAAQGRRVTSQTIARHVESAVNAADPKSAKKRHKERVNRRDVQLRPNIDSVADLTLYDLPADVAVRIYNRIDAIAKALKRHGDERTLGQLRADVAVSLLLGESHYDTPNDNSAEGNFNDPAESHGTGSTENPASAHSSPDPTDGPDPTDNAPRKGCADNAEGADDAAGTDRTGRTDGTAGTEPTTPAPTPAPVRRDPIPVRAKNVLHVSLTALLGLHEWGKTDPAVLGGFGPVIDEVAERILTHHLDNPDAQFDILVTHPQTGRPLQLHSVDARLFGGRLRDTVSERWQTCAFPSGCSRPAEQCIIDHSHDHALGGKTVQANGDPVCGPHDREKTRNGWRQEREGHDLIIWVDPFRNRYPVPAPRYGTPEHDPVPEPPQESEPPPDPEPDPYGDGPLF